VWRDGPMTPRPSPSPSGAVREETWPLLVRLAGAGLGWRELAALPALRTERVLCLCRRARRDERAALSLLSELAPELTSMRRRLERHGVEEDAAQAVTLSVGWEVVSGRREPRCPRSLRNLSETIWRAVRQEAGVRRLDHDTVPLDDDLAVMRADVDRLERWPGLLAAALAAGVLTVRQVVIVAQSRMDERPLAEVARGLGRPYGAVRKERHRAERALRAFARSYDWGGSS
jgi:DNA-directed RNA polymerase specialized sigma24 family protein